MSTKILGRRIDLKDLPRPGFKPPWRELDGWGRMRRVLFWVAQVGQIGLLTAAMTSGSDLDIKSDGTKAKKDGSDESTGSVKENPHSAGVDADVKAKDSDNDADGSEPESKGSEEGAKPKVEK